MIEKEGWKIYVVQDKQDYDCEKYKKMAHKWFIVNVECLHACNIVFPHVIHLFHSSFWARIEKWIRRQWEKKV